MVFLARRKSAIFSQTNSGTIYGFTIYSLSESKTKTKQKTTTKQRSKCWPATLLKKKEAKHKRKKENQKENKKTKKEEHDSVADKARNDKKTKEELTFITPLSLPSLATLALTRADVQVATVVTQLGAAV